LSLKSLPQFDQAKRRPRCFRWSGTVRRFAADQTGKKQFFSKGGYQHGMGFTTVSTFVLHP
jgi:hypothetical protein